MLISNQLRPAGTWDDVASADTVVLEFNGRHRRRHAMTGPAGLAFLLDLPQATALREGDGLVLSDGRIVRVNAAPEQLMEITAPDLATVVRIAWHLGNRHVPTQLARDRLRIRHDHVMMDMAVELGGAVAEIEAPFDPEAGASAHGAHDHHHGTTEAHAHTHEHEHH
jgi:urease accessory protein